MLAAGVALYSTNEFLRSACSRTQSPRSAVAGLYAWATTLLLRVGVDVVGAATAVNPILARVGPDRRI